MPFDGLGSRIAVELVADINQALDRCDIEMIDRGEIEDDGAQNWAVVVEVDLLATARSRVIPRTVLKKVSSC